MSESKTPNPKSPPSSAQGQPVVRVSPRKRMWQKRVLLILAAISVVTGLMGRWGTKSAPIVAILDTGISEGTGLNLLPAIHALGPSHAAVDDVGHGTRLARVVADRCPRCQILPIKVSVRGAKLLPSDLAAGIRAALKVQPSVILVGSGVLDSSNELEAQLAAVDSAGALLVVPAGVGLVNAFQPMPVSKLIPQRHPQAILVGAFRSPEMVEISQNFGSEIDVVAVPPARQEGSFLAKDPESTGSSFGAAWVAGLLAETQRRLGKRWTPGLARTWLALGSKLTVAAGLAAGTGGRAAGPEPRHGVGILDPGYPGDQLPVQSTSAFALAADESRERILIRIQVDRALPEVFPKVSLDCPSGAREDFAKMFLPGSAPTRGRWILELSRREPTSPGFAGCALKIEDSTSGAAATAPGDWTWAARI